MRGKVISGNRTRIDPGITPAYAGKSCPPQAPTFTRQDHPRVCGEKSTSSGLYHVLLGSPPRVRGKAFGFPRLIPGLGITPACAGKSPFPGCGRWHPGDHPRVCEEKHLSGTTDNRPHGSPPRMRGKVCADVIVHIQPRITPAYAGKSRFPSSKAPSRQDHPRVYGEKFHPASDRKLGRVRGTKRSSGLSPAAAPAGPVGSCPASPPRSYPPRITVSRPRP